MCPIHYIITNILIFTECSILNFPIQVKLAGAGVPKLLYVLVLMCVMCVGSLVGGKVGFGIHPLVPADPLARIPDIPSPEKNSNLYCVLLGL